MVWKNGIIFFSILLLISRISFHPRLYVTDNAGDGNVARALLFKTHWLTVPNCELWSKYNTKTINTSGNQQKIDKVGKMQNSKIQKQGRFVRRVGA